MLLTVVNDIYFFYPQRHGLKSKKLLFYDLLQTLAFKHCDGVVDIQVAPSSDSTDAVRTIFGYQFQFVRVK